MKKRLLILGLCGLFAAAVAFFQGLYLVFPPVAKAKHTIAEGTKLEPLSEVQSKAIEEALAEIDGTIQWEKETLDRSRLIAISSLLAVSVACLALRQSAGGNEKTTRPNKRPETSAGKESVSPTTPGPGVAHP